MHEALLCSGGQGWISGKARYVVGDQDPGLRAIEPDGHRRREWTRIIKARNGDRKQARGLGEQR